MFAPIAARAGRSPGTWTAVATSLALVTCAFAADKTPSGQTLLEVDWKSAEAAATPVPVFDPSGPDAEKLSKLKLPVLGFAAIPQLVKNVAGPRPEQIEPRAVIVDPKHPYWYSITETYDGITVSVSADRRVNLTAGEEFQIGSRKSGAKETLGTTEKPKVSILDGRTEEGMEGIIITYTVNKFPDIPYTVTIECAKRAVTQCKDINVINKDEALLAVVSKGTGKS